MSTIEQIQTILAPMLMVSPADITPETRLVTLNTSIGTAKLRLGLKRIGLELPGGTTPSTVAALLSALSGAQQPVAPGEANRPASIPFAAAHDPGGLGSLQIGIDVEDIGNLPVTADYWDHEFYAASFSKSEISYAILLPEPRTHFAGFWCAKEALRKCDPAFSKVSFNATTVCHDIAGRPYLALSAENTLRRLPHALSISHTSGAATAIVATIPAIRPSPLETIAPFVTSVPVAVASIPPAGEGKARKASALAKLFGL